MEKTDWNLKPVFEIMDGARHYKVFASGRTEGFSRDVIVCNRLSMYARKDDTEQVGETLRVFMNVETIKDKTSLLGSSS